MLFRSFVCHDETDNKFLFEHQVLAALAEDYPLEHWHHTHIVDSSCPYANPHAIDPICLVGLDFSAVLITVKAETLADIPSTLNVKNYCSQGTIGRVSIIGYDDLADDSNPPSDHGFSPIPKADSDDDLEHVELLGGGGYADALQAMGVPPSAVPHDDPSSATPAASIVSHTLARAPPLPVVVGDPLSSKPKSVLYKMQMGFFEVFVEGAMGERVVYRLPMRKAAARPDGLGLLVVNFASASVGILRSPSTICLLSGLDVDRSSRWISWLRGLCLPLACRSH